MTTYEMNELLKINSYGKFPSPVCTYPWIADRQDGTYQNPILCADYPDPDVIRVGEEFYMVCSSFNLTPGLPILRSKDLVNWRIIGHAIENLPHDSYTQVRHGCGIWAPSLRYHDNKFWIFFAMPDEGIFMTTAEKITGPWTKPHLVEPGKGLIDPCPLWDEDGQAYLVHAYAWSRSKIRHKLRVCPMAPDGSRLLGKGEIVFDAPNEHPILEGPKFMKKDGWYYILAPAGGVPTGWQVALRSQNVFGPYEAKIVLEQGLTPINGPHQGALVDTPEGTWWFIHFQDLGAFGRVVHLQPAQWKDGWPIIGVDWDNNGIGELVLRWMKPIQGTALPQVPQTSDEFDSPTLGLQWQWQANHSQHWFSLEARPGWIRLFTQPAPESKLALAPAILSQRLPAQALIAETSIDFHPQLPGEEAGLVLMGNQPAALCLRSTQNGTCLVLRTDGPEDILMHGVPNQAILRLEINPRGVYKFSFAIPPKLDEFIPVALPFVAQSGAWIGARIGIYSMKHHKKEKCGWADFDYLRFGPPDSGLS